MYQKNVEYLRGAKAEKCIKENLFFKKKTQVVTLHSASNECIFQLTFADCAQMLFSQITNTGSVGTSSYQYMFWGYSCALSFFDVQYAQIWKQRNKLQFFISYVFSVHRIIWKNMATWALHWTLMQSQIGVLKQLKKLSGWQPNVQNGIVLSWHHIPWVCLNFLTLCRFIGLHFFVVLVQGHWWCLSAC